MKKLFELVKSTQLWIRTFERDFSLFLQTNDGRANEEEREPQVDVGAFVQDMGDVMDDVIGRERHEDFYDCRFQKWLFRHGPLILESKKSTQHRSFD